MKIFDGIYRRMIRWVGDPQAEKYLYGLTFCESSFFPIPTDIMLAPMCAARPEAALRMGMLTTLFSTLGGLFGYAIGFFMFEWMEVWLRSTDYWVEYEQAVELFDKWGTWIIFVAAFSPIPYKIFTISAGVLGQNLLLFTLASLIGRGARFMLVAVVLKWIGPSVLKYVERWIEWLGWLVIATLIVVIVLYYL